MKISEFIKEYIWDSQLPCISYSALKRLSNKQDREVYINALESLKTDNEVTVTFPSDNKKETYTRL